MKKTKLIAVCVVLAFVMTLSLTAIASTKKATLINGNGDKVVVVVGSDEAQDYFGIGYVLMVSKQVGSAAGNTFEQTVNFYNNVIVGGKTFNASTTLTVARTITANEIFNNKTITVNSAAVDGTLSAASLDLTLAATSSLWSYLKNEGDEYTFDLLNQSPTAATTTEIVAGTGCQIVYGVADGDATIPGQKGATITIKRIKDWLADGGTKDCVVKIYEWN